MTGSTHIAVLENTQNPPLKVKNALLQQGCFVESVESTRKLDTLLQKKMTDLVIVDREAGDVNPVKLAGKLSGRYDIGIVFLSEKVDSNLRIETLKAGADDVLSKRTAPEEIVARVAAIVRRIARGMNPRKAGGPLDRYFRIGDAEINFTTREFSMGTSVHGRLTDADIALLRMFLARPNQTLTREEIAKHVGHPHSSHIDRSLDVSISRLRHKIEQNPEQPKFILTVRGAGYRYVSG